MPMMPGYNFVRARAKREAGRFFGDWFDDYEPTTISMVELLRCLKQERPLPHRYLLVEGFDRLWEIIDNREALTDLIHKLLAGRANWLMNQSAYICFTLPHEVSFIPARHVSLRLPDGDEVDLYPIFGQLKQGDSPDHYHQGFNIDS